MLSPFWATYKMPVLIIHLLVPSNTGPFGSWYSSDYSFNFMRSPALLRQQTPHLGPHVAIISIHPTCRDPHVAPQLWTHPSVDPLCPEARSFVHFYGSAGSTHMFQLNSRCGCMWPHGFHLNHSPARTRAVVSRLDHQVSNAMQCAWANQTNSVACIF